ncbi:hypothetical protein JTE90_014205 [Oedothorax gibbosus]|uniref:Uncharacterized protein n=1 Tax=Oedothorax gibbosus TaxID=931172 RepID=A0AAV6U4R7_9ARAC|nr:hypothetical protein JTE90_014205 [Oedothorax gibbosus]
MSTCNHAAKKMPLLSTCSSTKNMSTSNKISLLSTSNSPAKKGGGSEKNANPNILLKDLLLVNCYPENQRSQL